MLCLLERRPWMKEFTAQIVGLKSMAENCSRQLRAWADSLQNSPIQGQRHLNQKTRQEEADQKRAVTLKKELLRRLAPTHPLRREAEERGEI